MKARRHALILAIIKEEKRPHPGGVERFPQKVGVWEVTQATLSRDIKELGLIKIPTPEGSYRYALPGEKLLPEVLKRAERMFSDTVVAIDFTENLIVIKTTSGTAQGVAAILTNWIGRRSLAPLPATIDFGDREKQRPGGGRFKPVA